MTEKIKALAEKYNDYIIEKRRYFHTCPELPLHEEVEAVLKDVGE